MNRIGFIGLGTMGMPMAANLLKAGFDVTVYNRTKQKAFQLGEQGANVAESPAEVAKASDVVFTMLTADQAVEEVIFGDQGVASAARQGLIVVDSSTISPTTSKSISKRLAKLGVEALDAPVTGSEPQAVAGVLTFMAGGSKTTFEACLPLFNAMGKNAYYMGESGAGSYAKLANNTMAAINLLGLTESLMMATKAGVDPELFLQVVAGGGARSGMAENKGPKVLKRDFSPNFATKLMLKDLGLARSLASELNMPAPVLAIVREMLQTAVSQGYGEEDSCAVIKCYEAWAQATAQTPS
ncbi:NAD(P)-dependent oxidoreductase [Alicyclobacillus tolerans]|uniref:NAD(P)-dependent oxidoreductase n=1 Tax=Alicyclobacillus tolerans TaxID=90970 RepID=UPI001F436143|nr:NAD(P)-dependent oxidoreductase [Alicyclobacillus tolerans]MCF8565847.1 NAD(P)-dependent oxidoreductase [Alicyclobacillus tolerans]